MQVLFKDPLPAISFAKTLIEYDVSFTYIHLLFQIMSKHTLVAQMVELYQFEAGCVVTQDN